MNKIKNALCVINVITVTPEWKIERQNWVVKKLVKVNDGVYICTCLVQYG